MQILWSIFELLSGFNLVGMAISDDKQSPQQTVQVLLFIVNLISLVVAMTTTNNGESANKSQNK